MKTILVIEDSLKDAEQLRSLFYGYRLIFAADGRRGLQEYYLRTPHLIILDLMLPDMSGLELLDRLPSPSKEFPLVVVLSGSRDPGLGEEVLRRGAVRFFMKPLPSVQLRHCIHTLLPLPFPPAKEKKPEFPEQAVSPSFRAIIGCSPSVVRQKNLLVRYAGCTLPVLVLGESGTGKELFARSIHELSSRNKAPFVDINCAALPAALIESELFGSEPGAYTGSVSRPGVFEQAHGGSLFLDEIGELSPTAQAKLLRVIETGKVYRLGSRRYREVDVRLVSATNRPLSDEQSDEQSYGAFRRDLYYRIAKLEIRIPPLRDRSGDIEAIAASILCSGVDGLSDRDSAGGFVLSDGALRLLKRYSWPGNIRQLQMVLNRAMLLVGRGGVIRASDLDIHLKNNGSAFEDPDGQLRLW